MQKQERQNQKKRLREIGTLVVSALSLAVLGVAGMPAPNVAAAAWGPTRPTYTWAHPADHPTFNSITDNPVIGDERNFVRIRKAGTSDKYSDKVVLEVGQEYEIYAAYHNNASASLNQSGKGLAKNVRYSTALPERLKAGQVGAVKGTISSSNAKPTKVWDEAYMQAKEDVFLRYVPNSAVIHNGGSANGKPLDANALFSNQGAKLAHYNDQWGVIPGCNEFTGWVVYRVKIDKPNFSMDKKARTGDKEYADEITVKPGDKIDFKITYKNTGTTIQRRVSVFDKMPNGVKYTTGSTFLKTPVSQDGKPASDNLFNGGLVIGDFYAGQSSEITYKAEVADDKNIFPCGVTTVYNDSSVATGDGKESDKVKINVKRDCEGTPENPDVPKELPETGPGQIIASIIVIGSIGAGAFYYIHSKRTLSKIMKDSDTEVDGEA